MAAHNQNLKKLNKTAGFRETEKPRMLLDTRAKVDVLAAGKAAFTA